MLAWCITIGYVLVKSKLQYPPPHPTWATPWAFDFIENYCSKSPLPGPKCRSNAPTPGTFHRHINDKRMAETPSVVKQNLYKCSK